MRKISVIMGMYNSADSVEEAIECVLNQTYSNWEFIICDDGSTDASYAIALKYQEQYPNIILLKNEHNCGLNYTLNRCLEVASGEYIARMDADDHCSPERFQIEATFLDEHPDVSIVSTDMEHFDQTCVWGMQTHPEIPTPRDFLRGTPFNHATCMIRKEAYEAVRGYTDEKCFLRVEDYHLWVKMYSKGYKGVNIHKCLYQMRDDRDAYERRKLTYRINEARIKAMIIRVFDLPIYNYLFVLRPIIVGLLPFGLYKVLHRCRLNNERR